MSHEVGFGWYSDHMGGMWTQEQRKRQASFERRRYPTDLTDAQWAAITELVPDARPGGRPRQTSSHELTNAILYMLRGGQAWRLLPHDFPPWQTVYYYLRRWQAEGVWERIHHAALLTDRERAGRGASPRGAIIDSLNRPGITGGQFARVTPP